MQGFQKPEHALKRAKELIGVGQQNEALNVLHNTVSHRKFRAQGWDQHCEHTMMQYIHLCVDLQKLKQVREGLHLYRNITQQHNVLSLGKVMRELRVSSEKRLSAVKEKVASDAAAVQDDLEADESPEALMLSTLQVDVRDKTAKELHTALLGCWESYKVIMDILRYTPKLEQLYHDTAQKALEFCCINKRQQEFRRLCDTLRAHYIAFHRNRGKPDFEPFLKPERHLATRMKQLDAAADLGMWNQCFNTAEDIIGLGLHELLAKSLSSRDPYFQGLRSELLSQTSVFFEKLARIFMVSDNLLFHASAVIKNLFHTRQHKKSVKREEQVELSDKSTLAVLCIPALSDSEATTAQLEYKKKLASMLGHSTIPTRASMKHLLVQRGVVQSSSPAVQAVFALIDGDGAPLRLCTDAEPHLAKIAESPALNLYVGPIKRVIFHKLILRLSEVYSSMSIDFFSTKICPESFLPWSKAETIVVDLVYHKHVQLRLDYSKKAMLFGSVHSSFPEAMMKNQLMEISRVLASVVPRLGLPTYKEQSIADREKFYNSFEEKLEAEASRLQQRNLTVAGRRKQQEEAQQAQEEARRTNEKEKQRVAEREEQTRRKDALKQQEELRRREERQRMKEEIAEQIVIEFKAIAEKAGGRPVMVKGRNVEEITVQDIVRGHIEHEDYEKAQEEIRSRERTEKNRQRRAESKRVEHLARALREEEAPLLAEWKVNTKVQDEKLLAEVQAREEEESRQAFLALQQQKQTFVDLIPLKNKWYERKMAERRSVHEQQKKERMQRIRAILVGKKLAKAAERQKLAEERLRLEAERLAKEEEERLQQEALEKRRQEEEARRKKEQEMAQRQMAKEAEVTRKLEEEKERVRSSLRSSGGAVGGGSWRASGDRDRNRDVVIERRFPSAAPAAAASGAPGSGIGMDRSKMMDGDITRDRMDRGTSRPMGPSRVSAAPRRTDPDDCGWDTLGASRKQTTGPRRG